LQSAVGAGYAQGRAKQTPEKAKIAQFDSLVTAQFAMTGSKRRLTTILASDVVGYSRLMATDEEATLATLRTYRDVISELVTKHSGRIFSTAGDAVLAEFGSAVEAVRCAISIQEDLAVRNSQLPDESQMWFRIGINVGDVMVEGSDLFGDGVNVAARLEGLAEKGGICISASTFEQVKNKLSIAFSDIGPQSVKNIPEPIRAFRVVPGKVSVAEDAKLAPPKPKWRQLIIGSAAVLVLAVGATAAALVATRGRPPPADYPFDGAWQVSIEGRSGCRDNRDRAFPVTISQGKIDEPQQANPKSGEVSADGKFTISVFGADGRRRATLQGTLEGDTGNGSLIGGRCTGNVKLARTG
jgi:class 3 adenylate cyclase